MNETLRIIALEVAAEFGDRVGLLYCAGRPLSRCVAIQLGAEALPKQMPSIGMFFGTNHSNAHTMACIAQERMADDPAIAAKVAKIRDALSLVLPCMHKASIEDVFAATCAHYGIEAAQLIATTRTRAVAHKRFVAMALACEITGKSLAKIGNAFGKRDHTTVLHGKRWTAKRCRDDAALAADYAAIKAAALARAQAARAARQIARQPFSIFVNPEPNASVNVPHLEGAGSAGSTPPPAQASGAHQPARSL